MLYLTLSTDLTHGFFAKFNVVKKITGNLVFETGTTGGGTTYRNSQQRDQRNFLILQSVEGTIDKYVSHQFKLKTISCN